ncbi:MAG: hypothetical protein GY751_16880 [Bacteroidetes bacterium]|nr:hypothetical protein [Bacteroidota bacterium]
MFEIAEYNLTRRLYNLTTFLALMAAMMVGCQSTDHQLCEGVPAMPRQFYKKCLSSQYPELPVHITCGDVTDLMESDDLQSSWRVIGGLKTNEGLWAGIISYHNDEMDRLQGVVLDEKGKILSALCLYEGECLVETRREVTSEIDITDEGLFSLRVTTQYFAYMQHGFEYVRSLDSTQITTQKVLINDTGAMIVSKSVEMAE